MDFGPIKLGEPVIFVDGGVRHRRTDAGLVVGDDDSSSDADFDIKLPRDKDFSDLAYALDQIGNQFSLLKLHGFLGGRRDHEMMNFGEVNRWLQNHNNKARVDFDEQVIMLSAGTWHLFLSGIFSIVVMQPTLIRLTGKCLYTLDDPTHIQPLSSLGLSNVGHGEIELDCNQSVMLLQNDLAADDIDAAHKLTKLGT